MPQQTAGTDFDEVLSKMEEQVQTAVQSLFFQDASAANTAALSSEAIYTNWKDAGSPEELSMLRVLKDEVSLFVPLTRASAWLAEGRYAKALEEIRKGLSACAEALAAIDEYAKLPEADEEVVEGLRPVFSVFPIMFKGFDAQVRGETVGYEGNIPEYVKLLRESAVEYRRTQELPSSDNPVFLSLANFCNNYADRLEKRAEVFESKPWKRPTPTGDNILIIHGRDELTRRQLKDLLKDRFNLKALVLEEEPSTGGTLIDKFEKLAETCCYAFVLFTPDDFVKKGTESYFQARPNVLFELGWFYGRFGRDRTCIIKKGKPEIPSDLNGILSLNFQNDVSEKFVEIEKELKGVGVIKSGPSK